MTMAINEYASAVIPVLVTLGSLGILYPYFVEGFIIISFVIMVVLFLMGKLFEKLRLRGYFDILMASLAVIFALSYFQKLSPAYIATGILVLGFGIYSTYVATQEIKWAS